MMLKIVLGVLSCCPLLVSADFIAIENSIGESYVLHVDQHDTFINVLSKISSCEGSLREQGTLNENISEVRTFTVNVMPHEISTIQILSKKAKAINRSYASGFTFTEKSDISYIVNTLANSSLTKIKGAEGSLKKAGDRIDSVHPLQFLLCIFTSEELKTSIRNLQGRSWVWKDFLSGITETLAMENSKDNVLPFIQDFSARINVDANVLVPIIKASRWERFVNTLIDIVPREGGGNRYNL